MGIRYSDLLSGLPYASTAGLKVEVLWAPVTQVSQEWRQVLYLYQAPGRSIFYIGKAYDCSVVERYRTHEAEGMAALAKRYNALPVSVHVGVVQPASGYLSEGVVGDVEALLIRHTNPLGNIIKPTVTRNLDVTCSGSWPHWQTVFSHRTFPPMPGYRAR